MIWNNLWEGLQNFLTTVAQPEHDDKLWAALIREGWGTTDKVWSTLRHHRKANRFSAFYSPSATFSVKWNHRLLRMPPSLHVKRKRLPSTASLSNILIRLQPEKLAHLEQRSSLLSCLPSSQPQKQIRGETDRKLPSAKLPACWVKSFSLQLCKIKCNELHIRDCVKVSVLTSFPAFPSASQFYATKSNSSLFFALKMKAMNLSPHLSWTSTFSFLLY